MTQQLPAPDWLKKLAEVAEAATPTQRLAALAMLAGRTVYELTQHIPPEEVAQAQQALASTHFDMTTEMVARLTAHQANQPNQLTH